MGLLKESARLRRMRAAFAELNDEYRLAAAEVDDLQREQVALNRRIQDRVYVRNELQSSVQSLRTAIRNQEAIEQMAADEATNDGA